MTRLSVGDRESLPLKAMQVDVRVEGFRARVMLDLYYYNPYGSRLEGRFQIRLPDGASPFHLAFGTARWQKRQPTLVELERLGGQKDAVMACRAVRSSLNLHRGRPDGRYGSPLRYSWRERWPLGCMERRHWPDWRRGAVGRRRRPMAATFEFRAPPARW
ncbi:MAG: hypothetical protein ACYTGH_15965 [Planctomycetota bacterium]